MQYNKALPGSDINVTSLSRSHNTSNYVLTFLFCSSISVVLSAFYDKLFHWFLIPVVLCGTLIGGDAFSWFRKETYTFDVKAVFGLYGMYFFFMAPILHVTLNFWMKYVIPPSDWRPWLGYMAGLNLLGLILMMWMRDHVIKERNRKVAKKYWLIDKKRLLPVLVLALTVSLALQIWVYASRGGIMGYIMAYSERQLDVFQGMGWVFMISESFPILALIGYAVFAEGKKVLTSWPILIILILLYVVTQILFGGLRGSRSNTVFMIFWAIGIIHFWLRPIPKRVVLLGLAFIFFFMYIYGFYKGAGIEVKEFLKGRENMAILEEKTGRNINTLLLGDFSRSDVQAFILYRLSGNSDYRLAYGRSYLGDLSILIPKQLWPNRPPTKVKEGTNISYGNGSYDPNNFVSTKVYGLAGEAMLNFGPIAVPILFLIFGIFFSLILRFISHLEKHDARMILLPLFVLLPILILTSDLDNIIFFLIKNGLLPFLIIYVCSNRIEEAYS